MLRVRSIAAQCARGVVRSSSVARGEVTGARTVGHTVRTFFNSSSSQVLVAPQAPPVLSTTAAVEHDDSGGATGEEVVRHGKREEGADNADPLQQHVYSVSCVLRECWCLQQ